MSTEENQQALGRAVENYAANKNEIAALQQRAKEIGESLYELSRYLIWVGFGRDPTYALKARRALSALPSIDEIGNLVGDIEEKKAKRREVGQILIDAGVDPKE